MNNNLYNNLNNKEKNEQLSRLIRNISAYLDEHLEHNDEILMECMAPKTKGKILGSPRTLGAPQVQVKHIKAALNKLDSTFQEAMFQHINAKGLDDVDVYTKAHIDRRNFSKIRSNKNYKPQKKTAICLCLGLGLNLDETRDLLAKAGYTLSHSSRSDTIIEYCIMNDLHDIDKINEILYEFNEPLLNL